MPLTVTAWPYFPDPRLPDFAITGYGFGMVPPDRYRIKTVGALPPFSFLNSGVLVINTGVGPANVTYNDGGVRTVLLKEGWPAPQGGPPLHTIKLTLTITVVGEPVYTGFILQVFPPGIQAFDILVNQPAPPPDKIPNPVTMTPRNYLVTS